MSDKVFFSVRKSVTDFFRDLPEVQLSLIAQTDGQFPIYLYLGSSNPEPQLPGFIKTISPSKWHKFDLGALFDECVHSKRSPKTAEDLKDIISNTHFHSELNKVHLMASFVESICRNHEKQLALMKENYLLAPVHAIEQYSSIVNKAGDSLRQGINKTLPPEEANKVSDPNILQCKNTKLYLNSAKKQNESLIVESINSRTVNETTDLLTGVTALELSKHPGILGNIRGSLSALSNPEIKKNCDNAINIHTAQSIQDAGLPHEVAHSLLDSSTKISQTLSLANLTYTYESAYASGKLKEVIKKELDLVTSNSVKKMEKDFAQSMRSASQHLEKDQIFDLTHKLASTFSSKSPRSNTDKSKLLSKLLSSTILTLKSPDIDRTPKLAEATHRQIQSR